MLSQVCRVPLSLKPNNRRSAQQPSGSHVLGHHSEPGFFSFVVESLYFFLQNDFSFLLLPQKPSPSPPPQLEQFFVLKEKVRSSSHAWPWTEVKKNA